MSYTQIVDDLRNKHGVEVDVNAIFNAATTIMTTYSGNREREAKMREYIKESYGNLAEEYQQRKMQAMLAGQSAFNLADIQEIFNSYLEIVSEATKQTSERLKEESDRALDAAKKELAEAKAKEIEVKKVFEEAKKLYEEAKAKNSPDVNKLKADALPKNEAALKAEEERKRKERKEESTFRYEPYKPVIENFGLSTKEVEDIITEQVDSYTYLDARKFQLKNFGVRNPMFREELSAAFGNNVLYSAASAEAKAKMHESFVTKQLMQERLNSKGFFWKLFHRAETRSMREYIAAAEEALTSAKFPKEAEELAKAMAEKGFGAESVDMEAIKDGIKEKFAANDVKIKELEERDRKRQEEKELEAQRKLEEERKAKELAAKEEEVRKQKQLEEERIKKEQLQKDYDEALQAMQTDEYADKFFEKGFKPEMDLAKINAQFKVANRIGREYLQGNAELDKATKHVFAGNFEKIRAVKTAFEKGTIGDLPQIFESIDAKYAKTTEDYKTVKFADIKATKEKAPLTSSLGDETSTKAVEPPKKDHKLEKDAATKNI